MSLSRELLIFSRPLIVLIRLASLIKFFFRTPLCFTLLVKLSPPSVKEGVHAVEVLLEAEVEVVELVVVVVGSHLPSSGFEVRLTGSITPMAQPLGCRLVTVTLR
jgi:hypothetical protein